MPLRLMLLAFAAVLALPATAAAQTSFEGAVTAMCLPRSPSTRDIMIRLSGMIRVEFASDGKLSGTVEGSSKGILTGRCGCDGMVSGDVVVADGSRLPWTGEVVTR